MKESRRLTLNRETLADLTPGDLAAVQAGAAVPTQAYPCPIDRTTYSALCQWTFNTCECQ